MPDEPVVLSAEWEPFESLLEHGDVPVYGWRIVCLIGPDGRQWYQWQCAGDPDIDASVMALERVKFLLQMEEYSPDDTTDVEEPDEPDDEP